MDFLGIGPLELFFILLIALVIFGPNDIVKAARSLGRFLRKVVTSDGYRAFQQASKGMRDLPTTLMREAGIEENDLRQLTGYSELEQATKEFENQISPWTTPPSLPKSQPENPKTNSSGEETSATNVQPEDQANVEGEQDPQSLASAPPHPDSPFSHNIDD